MFGQRARKVVCKPVQSKETDLKTINVDLKSLLEKKSNQVMTLMNENAKLASQLVVQKKGFNGILG
jgi:hypothetical protein